MVGLLSRYAFLILYRWFWVISRKFSFDCQDPMGDYPNQKMIGEHFFIKNRWMIKFTCSCLKFSDNQTRKEKNNVRFIRYNFKYWNLELRKTIIRYYSIKPSSKQKRTKAYSVSTYFNLGISYNGIWELGFFWYLGYCPYWVCAQFYLILNPS